ncbi:MAG: FG-GAP-like repeat-containing protein [Pirellula sp.]|nr:FG-GAP-like repeat-containing protein [Pirellula sp.]
MNLKKKSRTFQRTALKLLCLPLLAGCWSESEQPKNLAVDVKWISLRDRSLALLENKASDDKAGSKINTAIEGFRNLTTQFPKDPSAYQNLAVALLIQAENATKAGETSKASQLENEFVEVIKNLKSMQPDAVDPIILESRLYQLKGDYGQAIKLLREACSKPNAGKDACFQLVELLLPENLESSYPEIRELLEKGLRQSPNNLVLNTFYLEILARLKDAKCAEHLDKCRTLFLPLNAPGSAPIPKLLDLAKDALAKGNWQAAQGHAVRMKNVLIVEIAYQQDLFYLRREDPLEYALIQMESLSPALKGKRKDSLARFEQTDPLLSNLDQVKALATEDIDMDGVLDLVAVAGDSIEAWSLTKTGAPKKILSNPVEASITGLVLVDLDRDFQRSREQIPPSPLPSTIPLEQRKKDVDEFVDTDVDLVAYGQEGLILFENVLVKESGVRELVIRPLSDEMAKLAGVRKVVAIDMDHDSDLDLIVSSDAGMSLWSNRGNWTFADVTSTSNLPSANQPTSSIVALDLDRNVLNDFLLGSDSVGPTMLASNLHGRYVIRDINWPKESEGRSQVVEAIDANHDACWDIVMGGVNGLTLVTMRSVGQSSWQPGTATRLSDSNTTGILVFDWDNDTFSDVVSWGKDGVQAHRGGADYQLSSDGSAISVSDPVSHVVSIDFDLDRDDDLIVLMETGTLKWLRNNGGNKNNQLELVLRADEDGSQNPRARCNMHGVGSTIEIKSDGTYQAQVVRGTRTRFGLGPKNQADIARVIWTNGIPNNIFDVDSRVTVFDQQNLGGSCPYLYAWNGERFEFVTDCLWAAPIGLQFAAGVTAPTRDWEYLKIDGQLLKPKDDSYVLQITEELWEAAYFDSVKLLAVDHPKEIDVFTNEKVGPAEISEFKIRTVENRLYPKSIVDQNGNDLREWTNKRDQRYTRTWTEGYNQGLTKPHWLEIDFRKDGESGSSSNSSDEIVLYMTGWLFPTCTSLNLASDENPLKPKLQPPSIQVPDADGNWVEVVPYAGFPGGKTKTIAIDLTGVFLCDDHRIRLVSNMELCWDEVFYTRGEREPRTGSFVVTPLELQDADLHYRGFSELIPQAGNAPKRYEYNSVTKESIWPPMTGAFTKYGDVTKLIADADDLQVVMGAGDEMTVRFSANVTNLPPGWVRDFVIYNVGWDKDADLNTIQGQDSGPLPFRGMARYPYAPEQEFPNTPAHVEFLKQYQTRYQDEPSFWNQIRDF